MAQGWGPRGFLAPRLGGTRPWAGGPRGFPAPRNCGARPRERFLAPGGGALLRQEAVKRLLEGFRVEDTTGNRFGVRFGPRFGRPGVLKSWFSCETSLKFCDLALFSSRRPRDLVLGPFGGPVWDGFGPQDGGNSFWPSSRRGQQPLRRVVVRS